MNLYLSAIGFSDMDSRQEAKFIRAAVKRCLDEGCVVKNDELERGAAVVRVSRSAGIYIFGRYEGKRFIYEYYYPFLIGSKTSLNDELTIERHVDKESYSVVCEESKTGVTLIFYLQNVLDYMNYIVSRPDYSRGIFIPEKRSALSKKPVEASGTVMAALSTGGTILLPICRKGRRSKKSIEAEKKRSKLIAAAKNGDEDAIESLTIEDIDTYTRISQRIMTEDVFSIVDSTFMPCGVECDQYSVVGEILEFSKEENIYTGENIYIMELECNNMTFSLGINEKYLLGEPMVGRRFKGQIWLQGSVKFV